MKSEVNSTISIAGGQDRSAVAQPEPGPINPQNTTVPALNELRSTDLAILKAPHVSQPSQGNINDWIKLNFRHIKPYFEAIKVLFSKHSAQAIHHHGRWDYPTENGHTYFMPSMPLGKFGGYKVINSRPINLSNGLGLERSQSQLTVLNNETGQILWNLPGSEIAALKTALVTMVALDHWLSARNISKVNLGIIGGGSVARQHLNAISQLFPNTIAQARTYSPRESGKKLAAEFNHLGNCQDTSLEELLAESNIIISATNASQAVVQLAQLGNLSSDRQRFLAGIGFHDLSPDFFARAEKIFSEDPIAYASSHLPLGKALQTGDFSLHSLSKILRQEAVEPQNNDGLTLFMPYGTATGDLAIALKLLGYKY